MLCWGDIGDNRFIGETSGCDYPVLCFREKIGLDKETSHKISEGDGTQIWVLGDIIEYRAEQESKKRDNASCVECTMRKIDSKQINLLYLDRFDL